MHDKNKDYLMKVYDAMEEEALLEALDDEINKGETNENKETGILRG